jgi:hypothetical protein
MLGAGIGHLSNSNKSLLVVTNFFAEVPGLLGCQFDLFTDKVFSTPEI